MALGHYPYPPETYANVFAQLSAIVDGDPPELPDSFSETSKSFVARCLHKIPNRRATYAELLVRHPTSHLTNRIEMLIGLCCARRLTHFWYKTVAARSTCPAGFAKPFKSATPVTVRKLRLPRARTQCRESGRAGRAGISLMYLKQFVARLRVLAVQRRRSSVVVALPPSHEPTFPVRFLPSCPSPCRPAHHPRRLIGNRTRDPSRTTSFLPFPGYGLRLSRGLLPKSSDHLYSPRVLDEGRDM